MNNPIILYNDDHLLVIDKPAGMLVHSGELGIKNQEVGENKTLVDWLLIKLPAIGKLQWPDPTRPGIVHRLDRDTSGVMLLAKTPASLKELQKQFAERTVQKTYAALVVGEPQWQEHTLRAPVSRAEGTKRRAGYLKLPRDSSKEAETAFTVVERFPLSQVTHVEAKPKTGRTHQIRVHLNLLELPILGDPWYHTKASRSIATQLAVPRLLLHARKLTHHHPKTGEWLTWQAPIPADIQTILNALQTKERA